MKGELLGGGGGGEDNSDDSKILSLARQTALLPNRAPAELFSANEQEVFFAARASTEE